MSEIPRQIFVLYIIFDIVKNCNADTLGKYHLNLVVSSF